ARRGEYREAEGGLAEALVQSPNDPYAHLLAGEVALRQGKLPEADKAFGQARKFGGAARAQWGIARVAMIRTDEAAQRAAIEETLGADPYLVEALLGSGRVMLRERRFNDALARFESGLTIAQKTPGGTILTGRKAESEARLGQSRAELAVGRAPEAKANLRTL